MAVIAGVVLGFLSNYYSSGLLGIRESLSGLLAGFLFLFLFYLMGGIGAGDVKFLAAAGSIKGASFVLIGGLYGAIIGGFAAVIVMLSHKNFLDRIKNLALGLFCFLTFRTVQSLKVKSENGDMLPYTFYLSIGLIIRWFELSGFFRF